MNKVGNLKLEYNFCQAWSIRRQLFSPLISVKKKTDSEEPFTNSLQPQKVFIVPQAPIKFA